MRSIDAIDRQAAIEQKIPYIVSDQLVYVVPVKILADLPSVQLNYHQLKGYWKKEDRGHVEYTAVCSKCGYATFWSDRGKFCSDCGAKMKNPCS